MISNSETRFLPHARMFAWEFPGVHSARGTALSRRIGQIAHGLADRGWKVSVLHCKHRDSDAAAQTWELVPTQPPGRIFRRAIDYETFQDQGPVPHKLSHKMGTLWAALRHGDRSGRWVRDAWAAATDFSVGRPDILIGCFTPRGPLALARAVHERHAIPWVADLQDPWWEGSSDLLRPVVARWMRRTLRTAARVIQVSPEWAMEDSRVLRRPVETLRHAVPSRETAPSAHSVTESPFTILYAGSLTASYQDVEPLMAALGSIVRRRPAQRIVLKIAGNKSVYHRFHRAASTHRIAEQVVWLGWLSADELAREIARAGCLLLIPFGHEKRRGVPSKLFEYIVAGRPILVAGHDSGGLRSLLHEWEHPDVIRSTSTAIEESIVDAINGDFSSLLRLEACAKRPLTERELARHYADLLQQVIVNQSRAGHVSTDRGAIAKCAG